MTNILGISAYYHDSAAALVRNGEIVSACQEERLTRIKGDHRFPSRSIRAVLAAGGIGLDQIDYLVFYDKPLLKFERLLETYLSYAPLGIRSFLTAMPIWLGSKLHLPREIRRETGYQGPILFSSHHESHAASAFYPSPFEEAAIICFDAVGEWTTTSYWMGRGNTLDILGEIHFPHSLGMLYSAFTYYTGFKVNSGEYKVMGLAPYGEPRFAQLIRDHLIELRTDGSFRLDMKYFNYCQGLTMTNERFHRLFGGPPRVPESLLTQRDLDLAASVQAVTEEVMLRITNHVQRTTGARNLCLAGGVALNCVGNGRILRESSFDGIWIQPAAGDAGGALGAALAVWHRYLGNPRAADPMSDSQRGSCLGPAYGSDEIEELIGTWGAVAHHVPDDEMFPRLARLLAEGQIVGWFSVPMEFGPRALGARSILGDPRDPAMQKRMNLKIKFRESFRPFAPAVLAEHVSDWFEIDRPSPYMLLVADVRNEIRIPMSDEQKALFGIDKLNVARSSIPAVTHVDYSARIQTVHEDTNPRFHRLIREFQNITGCPVLVNTSFNVRGEPIVCDPIDALRCFMNTDIDALVLESHLLVKAEQPAGLAETLGSAAITPD